MKRRSLLALLFASTAGPVWAQPSKRRHRIAIVIPAGDTARIKSSEMTHDTWGVFFEKLAWRGYIEGKNLSVERFSAEGRSDRFDELARAVVATKPDVILVFGDRFAHHFKAATTTIPIVILTGDPVVTGLVDNLARPGGNITGVTTNAGIEFEIKVVDYLRLAVPNASRIGNLTLREFWESDATDPKREAARRAGITLVPILVDAPVDEAELRRALAEMGQKDLDGLYVVHNSNIFVHFRLIIAWANEARVPVMYPLPEHVKSGGLMSYYSDPVDLNFYLAEQVAAVLKGTNPRDLPFLQPTRYRLLINLATARAQEIDIPPMLLTVATEVIE
jgi:putative tryptophan/tyrosine transport system substrate-binding protein